MINILITENDSSQRELVKNIKASDYLDKLRIYACHSANRVEVFKYADGARIIDRAAFENEDDFIQQYLEFCEDMIIDLMIVGKHSALFEAHREAFESKGVVILTGALSVDSLNAMANPVVFSKQCEEAGLPVVPVYPFSTKAQFDALYRDKSTEFALMAVKAISPLKNYENQSVSGFLRLDPNVSGFEALNAPKLSSPQIFSQLYGELKDRPDYILMPYCSGLICEVDVACFNGVFVAAVARTMQKDGTQLIEVKNPCIELAKIVVDHYKCDGLVGVKCVQGHLGGGWLVLEIQSQPFNGFGFSMGAGINLIAMLVDHVLKSKNIKVFINGRKWLSESEIIYPTLIADSGSSGKYLNGCVGRVFEGKI